MSDAIASRMKLTGPVADEAVRTARHCCQAWGVALPDVEPLVLDFGQGDFARVGLVEYWIANQFEAGYCGKYLFSAQGQQCPRHRHEHKHETFHIVAGQFRVEMDQTACDMQPGDTLAIPTGRMHGFQAIHGPALLLELSMPCDVTDNDFENPRIKAWLDGCIGSARGQAT